MFPGPSLHSAVKGGEATVLVTRLCCEETLCLGQLLGKYFIGIHGSVDVPLYTHVQGG